MAADEKHVQDGPDESGFDPRWLGAVLRPDTWHFHRRLFARYGIVLAPGEYSMIANAIRNGRAFLLKRKGPHGLYTVVVPSAGKRIYVLARPDGQLITVYPAPKLKGTKPDRKRKDVGATLRHWTLT